MQNTKDIDAIAKQLYPVFTGYDIKSAVIFGSYAKGTSSEESDIDLLVDSGLHGLAFVELMEDICRACDKPVDVLDVTHIIPGSKIAKEIMQTGVQLYAK